MKEMENETQLPPAYAALLRSIWRLNRVHNGDDTDVALDRAAELCKQVLRGEVRIHRYEPGRTYNHWVVPKRWRLRSFRLVGPNGTVLANESDHPLVVAPYSSPTSTELTLDELKSHVLTRDDLPDAYSFYFRRMYRHWETGWRLSLPARAVAKFPEGKYRVEIDATFTDEPMRVFEYLLRGRTAKTIFFAGHIDHPGMINDSLSGCLASLQIVNALERRYAQTEYTYRVLLLPEIIGSAIYLKANEELVDDAYYSVCTNMTSHEAPLAHGRSKAGNSLMDLALALTLKERGVEHVNGPFRKYPDCGDEISFDTVGYDIPSPTLSRIGERFRYYHTSHDDLERFLEPAAQARHQQLVAMAAEATRKIEDNTAITALFRGNPCLSNPTIDLYLNTLNVNNVRTKDGELVDLDGQTVDARNFMEFYLDAIDHPGVSVLEIAHAARLPFDFVLDYTRRFESKGLVRTQPVERKKGPPSVSSVALLP